MKRSKEKYDKNLLKINRKYRTVNCKYNKFKIEKHTNPNISNLKVDNYSRVIYLITSYI